MRDNVDAPRAGLLQHAQGHFKLVACGAGTFLVIDIVGGLGARCPGKQHRCARIAGIVDDLGQAVNRVVEWIDRTANVDTSTLFNGLFSGGNIRGAASVGMRWNLIWTATSGITGLVTGVIGEVSGNNFVLYATTPGTPRSQQKPSVPGVRDPRPNPVTGLFR